MTKHDNCDCEKRKRIEACGTELEKCSLIMDNIIGVADYSNRHPQIKTLLTEIFEKGYKLSYWQFYALVFRVCDLKDPNNSIPSTYKEKYDIIKMCLPFILPKEENDEHDPLKTAWMYDDLQMVKLLLEAGFKIDYAFFNKQTITYEEYIERGLDKKYPNGFKIIELILASKFIY